MDELEDGRTATFEGYVEALVSVIGHADHAEPLRDYCLGLMTPVARKSVEPLAAVAAPKRISAQHQSLLHFADQSLWSDEALLARVRDWVLLRMIERGGLITAWIIDDTIPSLCHHGLQHLALVVDGAPQIMLDAIDIHEDLVQMPAPLLTCTQVRGTLTLDLGGKEGAEPVPSEADCPWLTSTPRSCRRSSTFLSESEKRT